MRDDRGTSCYIGASVGVAHCANTPLDERGVMGRSARPEEVFCADCFTRLFNRNTGLPGAVLLYTGTLKESDRLRPILHMWTIRKQPWIVIDDGIPSFAKTPTPEEFGRIVENARAK